jgi:hypothetical protein
MACHRCDVDQCVNLDHFFIGTALDNSRDAKAKGRLFLGGSVCRYGHPMSGANLYIHAKSGQRHCRMCANARNRKYRRRQSPRSQAKPSWTP